MILCVLSVVILVVGIVLCAIYLKNTDDRFELIAPCTLAVGIVTFIICGVGLLTNIGALPAERVKNAQSYTVLTKQAEIYNNDPNKDYIMYSQFLKEAAEFNSRLYENKYYHNSIWVGIFNPDTFEGLDYIRYEGYIQYDKL